MTLVEFLILLLIAGVCGALGQAIAGVSRGGFVVAIALGFVGALIGRWLADAMDLPALFVIDIDGNAFPIVWSILGAALLVAVMSFLTKRKAA